MTENYDDLARCRGILYMYVEFSRSYNNSSIGVKFNSLQWSYLFGELF